MKKSFEIGETVRINDIDFVVLDAQESSIEANYDTKLFLLLKEPIGEVCFNADRKKGNNYCDSTLQRAVAQWFKEFEKNVPHHLLCSRTIDLLTLDGQENYGTMSFQVAPLTIDEFRRYGTVIPECEKSFWLATGRGAPNGGDFGMALVGGPTKRIDLYLVTDQHAIRPAIMISSQAVEQERFLKDFSTEELAAELRRRRNDHI